MRKSVFISIPATSAIIYTTFGTLSSAPEEESSLQLSGQNNPKAQRRPATMSADVAFFLLSLPVFFFSTQLPIVFTHVVHSLIRGDNNLWHLVLCCRCDQLNNSQSHASPSIAVHSQDRGSGSGFTGTRAVECWSSRSVARM